MQRAKLLLLAVVLLGGALTFVGCQQEEEGTFENMGEKMDDATEKAAEEAEKAKEKAEEAVE